MPDDSDLARLLPEPPPAAPEAREAAIEAALRRFDGRDAAAPPSPITHRTPSRIRRPQLVSLATMGAVALLSTSVWLSQRDRAPELATGPVADQAANSVTDAASAPNSSAGELATAPQVIPGSAGAAIAPEAPTGTDEAAGGARLQERAQPASETSAQPAPAPVRPDFAANSPSVVVEQQLNRLPTSPAPAAPAAERGAVRDESHAVMVTGSRIARPSAAPAADAAPERTAARARPVQSQWTACTLLDPARNLRACPSPAARSDRGRAAALLADGLTRAWDGDLDQAIAAFDRALEADGDFAPAYLNRGLAKRQQGDLAAARADFDRAVAADRRLAAAYHHRGQLREQTGDAAGARADAARAAQLSQDP